MVFSAVSILLLHFFRMQFSRTDQTFLIESYQIHTVCDSQCFHDQIIIFRVPVLDQCSLHCFFMRILRHIHRLHRPRIYTGIIHTSGNRRRCRVEILYLLRHITEIPQVFGKLYRFFHSRTRMGRHQIRNQILFKSKPFIDLFVFVGKTFINCIFRLAHHLKNRVCYMLRCNFQLTADMILTQFFEKRVIRIRQQIVKPDTGTDKYFFDSRYLSEISENA